MLDKVPTERLHYIDALRVIAILMMFITTFQWFLSLSGDGILKTQRKLQGSELSYFEFYQSFLQFNWWPEGNFHWLHLWFIPYLFAYNIVSIPICLLLNQETFFVKKIQAGLVKPYGLYVFILIAITPYIFLSVHYPTTHDFIHDYARHSFFIFFILAGLFFFRFKQLLATIEARRHTFFRLAFLSILIINALRWNGMEPFQLWSNWKDVPQTYLYIALLNFNS
ncbi:hypothetical protein ACUR5C_10295 [Aliikangiella sp. IMCC44653]